MRHEIHIGRNSLSIDLNVEEGGEGSGPSPHDLYDAALGACKALTVLWYAKHKDIPVEGIEVSVERDASQERAGIYRLSTALSLTGGRASTFGWVGHFISNLIASCAQPDTGFPPKVVAGR
jgi:putative redox protein